MAVKIVTGAIGSGKTEYCVEEIKRVRSTGDKRCIMLVPSHFSHETEKLIIDKFKGTGLNGIDVTTFEKLARELLSGKDKRLAAPGKYAVICRAVHDAAAALSLRKGEFDGRLLAAIGRSGFIDVAASLIDELHRYMVKSDALRAKAEEVSDKTLKQKLEIAALITENYDRLLADADYIDSDEDLLRLAACAGRRFGSGTSVWIDRFDEFLPQQLEVVFAIIDSGADVTLCFNTCCEEYDTYYGTRLAIECIQKHCDAELIRLDGSMRHMQGVPDLHYLFSTWHDRSRYNGKVKNAEVFEARDPYTEIEHTACRILDLVREDKYRFRDIAIICGNPDSYTHIIKAIFSEYQIPYYTDESFSIAEHPISMQILALFDILENNWDYSSMFEYLRAGFIYTKTTQNGRTKYRRIPADDIDQLENYVLKYGIRGKRRWTSPWTAAQRTLLEEALGGDAEEAELSSLDQIRSIAVQPLLCYSESCRQAELVSDYCRALYGFLEDINLYQGLKAELLGMAMNKATADAQRFGQIWNMLLDVLNQIHTALGSTRVTSSEFAELLRTAMGQCRLRTIPSGVDRVFIGSVEKNRSENSKVLFAIGAVSGTFPSDSQLEGFLSNADRDTLAEHDLILAPTTVRKNEKQYNNVYKTLSTLTQRLCISYPLQTPDGKACRHSQTIIDICEKLPDIPVSNDIVVSAEREKQMYISAPAATLHKLLIHNTNNPLWTHAKSWFRGHDEWRHKLYTITCIQSSFAEREISMDEYIAGKLYNGQLYYSPTHLNTYAQCPFRNFLRYGLGAREREEYQISAADAGSYAHEIVRRFCEEVDRSYDWKTIDDRACEQIVDGIISGTLENIEKSTLANKERMSDIFRRMGRTVKEVSKTVRRSIGSGSFRPIAYEKKICEQLTPDITIIGTIDRLDCCTHDGINEYRIIDYKTGSTQFSPADICEGLDMQPVIYALVLREMDKNSQLSGKTAENVRIAGMYYSKMRDDYAEIGINSRPQTVQSQLRKNTQLDGVTFLETEPDGTIVRESADRVETELARADGSLFFGKNGPDKIGGAVHSLAAAAQLMDTVRDKIIETDRNIRHGNIDIMPLAAGRSTVCSYCEFAAACRFDRDCAKVRKIELKDSEAWDMLEGKEMD